YVIGFLGDLVPVCLGELSCLPRSVRGPAPHHPEREDHREQPDYHERERQSAAHGHPFPSIALGAPLCCTSVLYVCTRVRWVYALVRAVTSQIRSTADLISLTTLRIYLFVLR